MKRLCLFVLLLFPLGASARVFSFTNETFAAYFSGYGGLSGLGTSAFNGEATPTMTYSPDVKYNYGGEFGFLYSKSLLNLRFGFEVLKPSQVDSTASNGSEQYVVSSDILGYAPKLSIEFNLRPTPQSRSFIALTVGSASVTLKNDYAFTAAYPGVDSTMEAKGSGTLLGASMGYEGILTDTTTIMCEVGYRNLLIDNLKYSKDVTTFTGAHASGDAVLNSSGEQRTLDFSGVIISVGFRFYL